jgi:16S rRNA (cytosine1402-N4)-methyltransferase
VANEFAHRPVLLDESITYLDCNPGATILDGTVGGAGHAEAILERTGPDGILIGLDRDPDALAAAAEKLAGFGDRVRLVKASFRGISRALADLDLESVDAVLFDLGVSSYQLDRAERGFRFSGSPADAQGTPLDMRMDPTAGQTAADLLRRTPERALQQIFQEYGELPGSKRLARAIVEARTLRPLETSADLLAVIREAHIGGGRQHHPATQVFQALRIAVNDEIDALREGLDEAVAALRPGGRIVVLAYHSLEDRVVKNHFRDGARGCDCPPRTPVCICGRAVTLKVLTRKPIRPGPAEIAANPRARSALLRAAERVEAEAA